MSVANDTPVHPSALGEEWQIECIAEQIELMDRPFFAWSISREFPSSLRYRVLREFVAAGYLRTLDLKPGITYVRTDIACDQGEPEMHVYRCYDSAGDLLYVGCTSMTLAKRLAGHKRKPWWPDVAEVRDQVVIGWQAARDAEVTAIKTERPRHNRRGNDSR